MAAGLSPANPVGAGLEPLTMNDRMVLYSSMRGRGMSDEEIGAELGQYPMATPPEATPAAPADDPYVGALGELGYGIRNELGGLASGTGGLLADHFGLENIGGALEAAGEVLGPTEQQEARQQAQQEARQRAVEEGELSGVGAFAADAGDAIVQSAPSLASSVASGAAGGAAGGAVFGPVGAAIGAVVGAAATSLPRLYNSAKQTAEGNGLDTSDPEVQERMLTSAAVGTAMEVVVPLRVLSKVGGPRVAQQIAIQSIAKRGAKEFVKDGLAEGMTEVGQLATEAIMLDDELRSKMGPEDRKELAPYIADRYGRDAALAFVSGKALGGGVGGATGVGAQYFQNAKLTKDIEALATVAEPAGVQTSMLEEAARDPQRAADLIEAADAIRTAERHRSAAQEVYNAAPVDARDDPGHPAQQMLARANRQADEVRDTYVPKFGGMTIAQMAERETKLAAETKSAAEARAAEIGIRPTEDVAAVDIDKVVAPLEEAKTERQQIEERLKAVGDESPKLRKKYEKELRRTRQKEIEAEIEARRVLTGADPDKTRADIKYEQAVEAHRGIEFPNEQDDPQATLLAADAVLMRRAEKNAETKTAEKVQKRIDDLVETRRGLDDPSEISKVSAEIAEEQAKLARPDPVSEAARRARQAALERLGQTDQSETVDGPAKPDAGVAEGPDATQSAGPALESEARPDAADVQLGSADTDNAASAATELPYEPERYFTSDEQTEVVPISRLRPVRARPEGIANAGKYMRMAYDGEMAPRQPVSVRREADGTYTVLDGNSTFANVQAAGWPDVPVRVLSDEQFAEESAPKFGKKTGTRTSTEGATIVARGPERQRRAVEQRATKEGLTVRFEPGSGIAADDPRRTQLPIDKQHRWKDKLDELPPDPTLAEAEDWLKDVGRFEHGVAFGADGTILGAGTHSNPNRIGIPISAGEVDTFTHNHPEQAPLSAADIITFTLVPTMQRLRAVLPDGQVVEAQRADGIDAMSPADMRELWGERAIAIDLAIPDDTTGIDRARLRQEAFLRHLDANGVIVYTEPLQGLTATEEDIVNGAVDAADAIAGDFGRLRDDAGDRAEAAGQDRADGGDRAQGAEGAPGAAGQATAAGLDPVAAYQPPAEAEFRNIETLWRGQSMARFPTVNSLLAVAEENNERLIAIGQELEAAIPGTKFHIGPVKTRESIERKLDTKLVNGKRAPAGRLADVVRGAIIVPTMRAANEVGQRLSRHPEVEVLDEGWNVTPYGYTDRKMTIRMPDGMMTELQVHFAPMLAAKEGVDPWTSLVPDSVDYGFQPGHTHYEVTRKPAEHTSEEVETATQAQLDIYRGALELLPGELFAKALRAAPMLANASGNLSRQALSSITLAAPSSPGGVGSQLSPVNQSPDADGAAPAGSSAGSRSQLRNTRSDTGDTPSGQDNNLEVAVQAQNVTPVYQGFRYDPGADPSPHAAKRISTRFPQQKQSVEDPLASALLQIDTDTLRANPATFEHNAGLVPDYPAMGDISGTADEVVATFRQRVADNLVWLYEQAPDILRTRGHHWYDGARRITDTWSARYGLPDHTVAGVLAALSPQKDWYQNVTLAERVIDTVMRGRQQRWTPSMGLTLNRIYPLAKIAQRGPLAGQPTYGLIHDAIRGKTLDEVIATGDPIAVASWIRVFDETFNDRAFSVLSPEGDLLKPAGTKVAWGSNSEIAKAVSVILDPSLESVSRLMGENHKVRSFYNNIVSPNSNAGDVTIDTHAVAAAHLRPLSGNMAEVADALGTSLDKKHQKPGYRSAKRTGIAGGAGLYGIYADAYRDAATRVGILPRQLQSITWEAVRLLYPAADKRGTMGRDVETIWAGEGTYEEKRDAAYRRAGGIGEPSWERPAGRRHDPASRATYKGPLSFNGVPERPGASGGARGGAAGNVPADGGGRGAGGGAVPAELGAAARAANKTNPDDGDGPAGIGPEGADARGAAGAGAVDRGGAAIAAGTDEPAVRGRGAGAGNPRGNPRAPRPGEAVAGLTPTQVWEYPDGRNVFEVADPAVFTERARAALDALGPVAAQVGTDPGQRQFLFDDGGSGFALDGDNVISVFGAPNARGVAARVLDAAVAAGGRRLDGFDTFLPRLYARYGFRAVARLPFNREHAPTRERGAGADWDYDFFAREFGTAEPDVVFMVHDPATAGAVTDNVVTTYEDGIAAQDAAIEGMTPALAANLDALQGYDVRGRQPRTAADAAPAAALRDLGSGLQPEVAATILRNNALTPAQRLYDLRHRATSYSAESAAALLQDGGFNGQAFRDTARDHAVRMRRLLEVLPDLPERTGLLEANLAWSRDRQRRRTRPKGGNAARYIAQQIEDGFLDERDFTARAQQLAGVTRDRVRQFLERGRAAVAANVDPLPGGPAPLYASRRVMDGTELYEWAIDAGIPNVVPPDEMHVTVAYSQTPVDPAAVLPATDELPIQIVDGRPILLKDRHVVMPIESDGLRADHQRYRDAGASHDYDDGYKPHATLAYDLDPETARRAVDKAGTFTGSFTLGPEHQEGLRTDTASTGPSLAIAEAVTVPRYLDVATEGQKAYQNALQIAKAPTQSARTAMEWVEDNIFNGFAPIRRLEMQVKGKLGIGMDSAFKAAEIAVNDSGRNEALLFYGAGKLGARGEFTIAPGTIGLRPIFDMAVEGAADKGQAMVDWMSFMVARRAQYLKGRGIRVPLTDQEIADATAKSTPAFQAAADAWKAHNDANIDFLVDTGRITKAQAAGMKQDDFYVPFYRTDKRVDGQSPEFDLTEWLGQRGGRGAGSSAIMARDPRIKKIVGGDKQAIDNLLQTMVRNSQAMVSAGMRNHAANKTFDLLTQSGLAQVTSASKRSQKTGKIVAKKKPHNSVRMWVGGSEKYVIVDEGAAPIVQAMAGLTPLQLGGIQALFADIGSIFRQSITLSPAFMIRNAIRGAVATGVLTSGQNLTLTSNTMTGFREAIRKSDATQAFARISGMGDYRFGGTDVGLGDSDILINYGVQPKTWGYRLRQALDKAEAVGTATELADRIAAFRTMQANGIREDEAAYQALTVMNYGRRGGNPTLRAFLPMVPFLNARLQGLSRLAEGAVGRRGALGRKQAMLQLALNGGILMLGSAALWAWNNEDEERREKYKGEPLWRRQNYHIVYLGDRTLMIPKAFELGHVFSTIPEMMLDAVANDMGDELDNGVVQILGQTFGFNAIPAAVLPIIEGAANYSFFRGGPIVGQREMGLLPRDRTENATGLSKLVGRQLGISDAANVSPTMIEHYLQGYGGVFYSLASAMTDAVGAEIGLTPAPPAGAFGAVPVISPTMTRAVGSVVQVEGLTSEKYIEEFYRTKDHLTQTYQSAKIAATNGDVEYAQRLLARHPGLVQARSVVNKASRTMGELNTAIRTIKNDRSLSAGEKAKRLAPVIQRRNRLAQQVVEAVEMIEERAEAA